jgi:uncharacterized protein YukJ
MPLEKYGVFKGAAVDRRLGSGANPHYQIRLVDNNEDYRIAVNVQSQDQSEVQYVVDSHFSHPLLEVLHELPLGFKHLKSEPNGAALDLIRGNLVDPKKFVPLPISAPGPDNDLNEKLDQYVQRAMADEDALLYAFGERWGPESVKDKIFGFSPGNGVHDIHMNQGNDPKHKNDDGIWQDGGLIFQFPKTNQWVAIFLRFQSQAWHTHDKTGHALPGGPPSPGLPPEKPAPIGELPTTDQPDGMIRIVAALVNDKKTPERETVTLLNTSPQSVKLGGWFLLDKAESKMPLSGELAGGEVKTFVVQAPMVLSNKGGLITLVNSDGLKVDGVSYTKKQANNPGWTVKF